jgi:hypothetical protein
VHNVRSRFAAIQPGRDSAGLLLMEAFMYRFVQRRCGSTARARRPTVRVVTGAVCRGRWRARRGGLDTRLTTTADERALLEAVRAKVRSTAVGIALTHPGLRHCAPARRARRRDHRRRRAGRPRRLAPNVRAVAEASAPRQDVMAAGRVRLRGAVAALMDATGIDAAAIATVG